MATTEPRKIRARPRSARPDWATLARRVADRDREALAILERHDHGETDSAAQAETKSSRRP